MECLTIAREDRCLRAAACMYDAAIAELHAACMASLTSLVCRWIECQTDVAPIQTTCLHLQLIATFFLSQCEGWQVGNSNSGKLNSRPSRHDVYTITENITGVIFLYSSKKKNRSRNFFFPGRLFKFPGRFALRPRIFWGLRYTFCRPCLCVNSIFFFLLQKCTLLFVTWQNFLYFVPMIDYVIDYCIYSY